MAGGAHPQTPGPRVAAEPALHRALRLAGGAPKGHDTRPPNDPRRRAHMRAARARVTSATSSPSGKPQRLTARSARSPCPARCALQPSCKPRFCELRPGDPLAATSPPANPKTPPDLPSRAPPACRAQPSRVLPSPVRNVPHRRAPRPPSRFTALAAGDLGLRTECVSVRLLM